MKLKAFSFLLISIVFISIIPSNTAEAHRCRPDSSDFILDVFGPFPKNNCMAIVDNEIVIVDCTYYIYQVTCAGVYCDPFDNSMYIGSDCTIDDQPPGNVPIWLPSPCNSGYPVSYIWQSVVDIDGDEGCSAICWYCLPGEVPTKSLAEEECTVSNFDP